MKSNIALIGYMGTGKTAVGKALAERIGKKFIEMDWLIEEKAGKKIADVFKADSETGFRELEIAAVKEIAEARNSVIACGGGVVLNKINIDRLRTNAIMVYLTASPKTILKRVSAEQGQRPLLNVEDQLKTISDMLKFRRPFYDRAADITVNTSKLGVDEVVNQIIEKVGKRK